MTCAEARSLTTTSIEDGTALQTNLKDLYLDVRMSAQRGRREVSVPVDTSSPLGSLMVDSLARDGYAVAMGKGRVTVSW